MSIRTIRQALTVGFGLTLSSIAFARNPPSLVKQQEAAASSTRESAGYRDMSSRFGSVAARTPQVMRADGGYRDINHRFGRASHQATHAASASTTSRWR